MRMIEDGSLPGCLGLSVEVERVGLVPRLVGRLGAVEHICGERPECESETCPEDRKSEVGCSLQSVEM